MHRRFHPATLLLALTACSESDGPPQPGDPAAGATVYAQTCAACHQVDGSGLLPSGQRLAASFKDPAGPLSKSDAELLQSIQFGKTGEIGSMPPWRGTLSAQQQRDALAYLRERFAPPRAGP